MAEALVLGPDEGRMVQFPGLGVRFMVDGERSGGNFALVEHPLDPRALASPMHTHANEDEYSFVIEGRMGAQIGDEVLTADQGALVFKPRGVPHAFWNASDEPTRVLEIIAPAGFERYFDELGDVIRPDAPPDVERMAALWAKYGLEMDMESVPRLVAEHGLTFPQP